MGMHRVVVMMVPAAKDRTTAYAYCSLRHAVYITTVLEHAVYTHHPSEHTGYAHTEYAHHSFGHAPKAKVWLMMVACVVRACNFKISNAWQFERPWIDTVWDRAGCVSAEYAAQEVVQLTFASATASCQRACCSPRARDTVVASAAQLAPPPPCASDSERAHSLCGFCCLAPHTGPCAAGGAAAGGAASGAGVCAARGGSARGASMGAMGAAAAGEAPASLPAFRDAAHVVSGLEDATAFHACPPPPPPLPMPPPLLLPALPSCCMEGPGSGAGEARRPLLEDALGAGGCCSGETGRLAGAAAPLELVRCWPEAASGVTLRSWSRPERWLSSDCAHPVSGFTCPLCGILPLLLRS